MFERQIAIKANTLELEYVKENFVSTFIPSICPSLVDFSVREDYKNENKNKKSIHAEIDYNSIKIDTRPGAF